MTSYLQNIEIGLEGAVGGGVVIRAGKAVKHAVSGVTVKRQ